MSEKFDMSPSALRKLAYAGWPSRTRDLILSVTERIEELERRVAELESVIDGAPPEGEAPIPGEDK
jgi:hypothetical protein